MIPLVLYSRDPILQARLAATVKTEFSVTVDSDPQRVKRLLLQRTRFVVVVDFECCAAREQFGFLEELRGMGAAVVVVTEGSDSVTNELQRRSIRHFCMKPVDPRELAMEAREAYEAPQEVYDETATSCPAIAGPELDEPPQPAIPDCDEIVGSSVASQSVYHLVRRVANVDVSVLITGESGTGKEVIARAIHSSGNRRMHPFVAVSCGAIPDALIESELFGSEKGSFTGAAARRNGYFEEAGRGTLLLDEIGELSHQTQIKLLRVLQQREFMRLGSSTPIPLRARMLFATNRNLKEMVAQGSFREDLYYRLKVVGIHSRPLRERPDDIPLLVRHFVAMYAGRYRSNVTGVEPEAQTMLRMYSWPGNIRELENVIQSAIILSDGDTIGTASLPDELHRTNPEVRGDAVQWASFEDQLKDYKTRLALDAVRECNGNKTLAAQSLNISRTYLHRLIREPEEESPALRVA